jgi:urea carboxylase
MWNRYRETAHFKKNKPWLLRFFDQIRFYPVTENELRTLRKDLLTGRFQLEIQESSLNLKRYHDFLQQNESSITAFKTKQQAAFEAERRHWEASGQSTYVKEVALDSDIVQTELDLPKGAHVISSHVTGMLWKLLVQEGSVVKKSEILAIVESMKMEFAIEAPLAGRVGQIWAQQGNYVSSGQALLVIQV